MAIKNYIVKNKKKSTCLFLALAVCMVSIFAIVSANKAKAGVFVTDDEGNKTQINELKILEIVAREGEQVLGYTVEGQEPISVSDIESYSGPMDLDVDDFKDATGYVVEKTENTDADGNTYFTYKVKDDNKTNILNHTFNDNVLGSSMSVGEIKVEAMQASDIRVRNIEWADLIYINSNDYNDNLLYYYDQFVNNGSGGINPGEKGETFTGTYMRPGEKKLTAISKIILAAGNTRRASELTTDDFEFVQLMLRDEEVNIDNFKEYNTEYYKNEIANLEDTYFSDDIDEAVKQMNEEFAKWNELSKEEAKAFIRSTANSLRGSGKISEALENDAELKEKMLNAFKRNDTNYLEVNSDDYIIALDNAVLGLGFEPAVLVTDVNTNQAVSAMYKLATIKADVDTKKSSGISQGADENEWYMTEDDVEEFVSLLKKSNQGEVNDFFAEDYSGEFFDNAGDFTGASDADKLRDAITDANNTIVNTSRNIIAKSTIDNDQMDKLLSNSGVYYEAAQITGYNKFFLGEYTDELLEIVGTSDLLGADGEYDLTKLEKFISDVNKSANATDLVDTPCDITWKVASEIIDRVFDERVALMYNTQLLTEQDKIGDYEDKESIDNTNNVFKMLLVTRQLRDSYYSQSIKDKVDKEGMYYPNGFEDETGKTASWSKYTFAGANDFKEDGSVNDSIDFAKYHEPNVVGNTYALDGTQGNSVNYVYKRIYSFTGNQFFGGKNFSNPNINMQDFVGVVTAGAGYREGEQTGIQNAESTLDIIDGQKIIFLNTTNRGWSAAAAYFWNDGTGQNNGGPKSMKKLGTDKYYIIVPDYADHVIFTPQPNWNGGQTKDIKLPNADKIDGTQYHVVSSDAKVIGENNYRNDLAISTVFLTNSIYYPNSVVPSDGDTSHKVKYTGNIDLKVKAYNADNIQWAITNAGTREYKPINDGEIITLDPANNPDQIDNNARTTIELKYNNTLSGNTNENKSYYYYKYQAPGYVNITNFINDGTVEYCEKMSMTVSYNVSGFQYSDNGGSSWKSTSDGSTIEFGEGDAVETKKEIRFRYTINGASKVIKTTIYKRNPDDVKPKVNYLSLNTATNSTPFGYDNTLSAVDNNTLTTGNKGDVIRYILRISLNEATYPINVLEIQPAAAVNEYASYEGAVKIAGYLNIDAVADGMNTQNYENYINVTYMSVKEFNTRNEDLTANYDLIYFGIDSGYQVVTPYNTSSGRIFRTRYNDTSMNGLVYTGIGDKYLVRPMFRGAAADDYTIMNGNVNGGSHRVDYDYWVNYFTGGFTGNDISSWNITDFGSLTSNRTLIMKNEYTTTRLGGNDITVKRMEDLLEYLKSGYPILLADEIMNCDSSEYIDYSDDSSPSRAADWRYVDVNSKMYNFIVEAKKLGYDDASGTYSDNSVFYDGKPYASLVSVSNAKSGGNPEYLSTSDKFEGGLSYAYKRNSKLEFEYVSGPREYGKDAAGNHLAQGNMGYTIQSTESDYRRYTIIIGIKRPGGATEEELANYGYRGYIDKSGVGKFENDVRIDLELNHEYIYNEDGKVEQIKITGNWPGAVEGFIPWRIEIYNKNNENSKFSYTGYSSFAMANQAVKDVYVLWIRPDDDSAMNLNFRDVLEQNDDNNHVIANYKIHLITMSYTNFVNMYRNNPNSSSYANDVNRQYDESTSLLKVEYVFNHRSNNYPLYNMDSTEVTKVGSDKALDMIVIGFADSKAYMDINNIAALKDLDYFLDAGHSMLFSHDNVSYHYSINKYINGSDSRVNGNDTGHDWGRYNTSYLRKRLGMDQYGITYGGSNAVLPAEYFNARKYIDTTNAHDYRGISEVCVFHYNLDPSKYKEDTQGSYMKADDKGYGNMLYSKDLHGTTALQAINGWCHTKEVMRTNEGQITNYPFIIGDYLNVANTHSQYMTLNLEDTDTTVWYVLDDHTGQHGTSWNVLFYPELYKFTKGDGANNYYIYSKGNITYTGAGHSKITGDAEKKLFINTVIAALKAGNYEPEVNVTNAYTNGKDKCIDYTKGSAGATVIFRPIDYDLKEGVEAFTDCKIFVDLDKDGKYDANKDIMLNNDTDENGSTIMHAANGTDPINFYGPTLLNRIDYTFFLTTDDMNTINGIISSKGGTGTIFDYKIVIQVSDKGYLKAKNPVPATASTEFKLVEKEPKVIGMYNLD